MPRKPNINAIYGSQSSEPDPRRTGERIIRNNPGSIAGGLIGGGVALYDRFMDKVAPRRKGKDVKLPNESGRIDPRIYR